MHTTGGYLTQCRVHAQARVRPRPRHRRLLVHRRRRLGHRPLLHRLRAAREPHDERALRGHARLPRQGPPLVDRREVQGDDLLHRAHRDPHVHEVGRRVPGASRPVVAAADGNGRRADQPRGVGLVLPDDRRRSLPGRRHVVADRDRRDHDQRAARARRRSKPGSATFPLPGIQAGIVDDAGKPVGVPGGGYLVLERPWPSMLRGIWGDPQRYRDTYWSRFDGKYFAGDGAKRDDDGYFWLLGRVDDIMLVSGHNISTTEVESALVDHPAVAEAAVVGKADDTTGQAIAAFVTCARASSRATSSSTSCATTSPSSSARSRSRSRSCSPRSCRRRARARSCAGCCATSPRTRRSAT